MDFEMFLTALTNVLSGPGSDFQFRPVIFAGRILLERTGHDLFYCPIAAVCLFETGKEFRSNNLWRETADELGLDRSAATRIISAADCEEGYDPAVRKRLLKILNLKEAL